MVEDEARRSCREVLSMVPTGAANVKLCDFGLSAPIRDPTIGEFTEFLGTPPYMAPELWRASDLLNQIKHGKKRREHRASDAITATVTKDGTPEEPEVQVVRYGAAVDVWALGVTLFVLLTGSWPFWADTHTQLCRAIQRGQWDAKCTSHLSAHAQDLLKQLLCVDETSRITASRAAYHPWITDSDNRVAEVCAEPPFMASTIGWGDRPYVDEPTVEIESKAGASSEIDQAVLNALCHRSGGTLDEEGIRAAVAADTRNHLSAAYWLEQRVQRAIMRAKRSPQLQHHQNLERQLPQLPKKQLSPEISKPGKSVCINDGDNTVHITSKAAAHKTPVQVEVQALVHTTPRSIR